MTRLSQDLDHQDSLSWEDTSRMVYDNSELRWGGMKEREEGLLKRRQKGMEIVKGELKEGRWDMEGERTCEGGLEREK